MSIFARVLSGLTGVLVFLYCLMECIMVIFHFYGMEKLDG